MASDLSGSGGVIQIDGFTGRGLTLVAAIGVDRERRQASARRRGGCNGKRGDRAADFGNLVERGSIPLCRHLFNIRRLEGSLQGNPPTFGRDAAFNAANTQARTRPPCRIDARQVRPIAQAWRWTTGKAETLLRNLARGLRKGLGGRFRLNLKGSTDATVTKLGLPELRVASPATTSSRRHGHGAARLPNVKYWR